MADTTREQAQAMLAKLGDTMHTQHAGATPERLVQLDSHLATVAMIIDQLYDAAERGEHD
jgi:hypothetical protein